MTSAYIVDKLRAEVDELVASHSTGRDVRDFRQYLGRPLDFMRIELDFHPYEKQIEVIEAFEAERRTAVRGCHGAGKDALLAPLMLYAAYVRGMLVLAISATERQLLGQLWREVGNRFSARLPGQLFTGDLRINDDKRIVAMTSGSTSNLTGWHDPSGVFVAVSEAQGEQVEDAAFDAAIANCVDDASRIVVVGNPVKAQGRFYEVSKKATWRAIEISAFDHPNVREGRVIIPGGPAPTWPAEMAAEFGEESPWYISRVLGRFPPAGSVDSLVKREWLEAAYARHGAGDAQIVGRPLPVVALDVARSLDRDESVAAVAQRTRLHALHAWHSRDLVDTAGRFLAVVDRARLEWYATQSSQAIDDLFARWQEPTELEQWITGKPIPQFRLLVDSPGIGSGVVDDCRRRGRTVDEYWGWVPAREEKRFANRRAEVYWHFRTLCENGTAELPRDDKLHDEALAMEWSQDAKGRILMISKEELRKSIKRSPDRLDSSAMALWAAGGRNGLAFQQLAIKW